MEYWTIKLLYSILCIIPRLVVVKCLEHFYGSGIKTHLTFLMVERNLKTYLKVQAFVDDILCKIQINKVVYDILLKSSINYYILDMYYF